MMTEMLRRGLVKEGSGFDEIRSSKD